MLPNDAGVHNNLGNALGRLGELDEAVASFRRALLFPDQRLSHLVARRALAGARPF